ncbi:hypothetical protein DV515_00010353 [Chloebia gouldiae]|uniref:Uncharacterized protein n=1 Tax=Chloebia gouldiae TaxID=44316 RepID=A0A3L8S9D7_CHLGU|nr:hypothetical protein DV515_00010353 [Chloebia gouldiae]
MYRRRFVMVQVSNCCFRATVSAKLMMYLIFSESPSFPLLPFKQTVFQFLKDLEEITCDSCERDVLQTGGVGLCFVTTLPLPSKMDVLVVFLDFLSSHANCVIALQLQATEAFWLKSSWFKGENPG